MIVPFEEDVSYQSNRPSYLAACEEEPTCPMQLQGSETGWKKVSGVERENCVVEEELTVVNLIGAKPPFFMTDFNSHNAFGGPPSPAATRSAQNSGQLGS